FLVYRQRALGERSRPRKVALALQQDGEVVEAFRRLRVLGAEHLFADCQGIAKKRRGLGVSCAAMEITACPIQKFRNGSVIRGTPRQQMWRERRAQRPRLRVGVSLLWVGRCEPCNQSPDGVLRPTVYRPCSCHCLHETMDRHRRTVVLEWVVL